MATLKQIRRRIRGVENIHQITRAMKMIAAARLRKAEQAILALRPYASHLEMLAARFFSDAAGTEHPFFETRDGNSYLLVALTSDRGLCGAYNNNVIRACVDQIRQRPGSTPRLHAVGRKGIVGLQRLGYAVAARYTDVLDAVTFERAEQIVGECERLFLEEEVDEVLVVYTEFFNPVNQQLRTKGFLPCDPTEIMAQIRKEYERPLPKGVASEPEEFQEADAEVSVYEPDYKAICADLVHANLTVQFYRILIEAQASEHGARMVAMDNATDNAEEMIEQLSLQMNRQRQETITRELLDIVGGAEQLR